MSAVRYINESSTIDGHEIRIRVMCGSYLLKSVDKGMVNFLFVILMFRTLQLLYIIYSRQRFDGKVKPTQCYFRFKAINRKS